MRPQRAAGAQVVGGGALLGWIGRAESNLFTFLPAAEPERGAAARAGRALARLVDSGRRRAVLCARSTGRTPATRCSRHIWRPPDSSRARAGI